MLTLSRLPTWSSDVPLQEELPVLFLIFKFRQNVGGGSNSEPDQLFIRDASSLNLAGKLIKTPTCRISYSMSITFGCYLHGKFSQMAAMESSPIKIGGRVMSFWELRLLLKEVLTLGSSPKILEVTKVQHHWILGERFCWQNTCTLWNHPQSSNKQIRNWEGGALADSSNYTTKRYHGRLLNQWLLTKVAKRKLHTQRQYTSK